MLCVTDLIGFAAQKFGDIAIVDDGDAAPSSGTTTDTHTYDSQTSVGPTTVLAITWDASTPRTLSTATWNGVAMAILDQVSDSDVGAAIAIISGAQSGSVVLTFSGTLADSHITKISLANLRSHTPVDVDEGNVTANSLTLSALASPGVGGIRIVVAATNQQGTGNTWTNATEISDLSASAVLRHSAAYDLGDDGGNIVVENGAGEDICAVGVSLR